MHEIEQWRKNGKPWAEGLVLLSKYGTIKSVYNSLIQMGESKTTHAKLEDSLAKALKKLTPAADVVAPIAPTAIKPPISPFKAKPIDTQVDDLDKAANKVYAEMGALHARILATATQSGRKALYSQIKTLQSQWALLAWQRDYLAENGVLPEPPTKKVTNAKNLQSNQHAELMLLRSKVTRARKEQIPNYQSKKGPKWKNKLEARLIEVEEWEKKIKELEALPNG